MESLDSDGDFSVDVNFSLGKNIPCVILEDGDFDMNMIEPEVSCCVNFELSVNLDD